MATKTSEVKAYKVQFYCDHCNNEVTFAGNVGMSNPPRYQHTCKCGASYWLDAHYPTIIFK